MRAVVTRVKEASVKLDGKTVGEIGVGFLVLLGVGGFLLEKNYLFFLIH